MTKRKKRGPWVKSAPAWMVAGCAGKHGKEDFQAFRDREWRTLRMDVLKIFGRACQCCGATPKDKAPSGGRVRIVVDHIKPVSKFWHLRLDRSNLQVLCDECNQGKGNWDQTDYREQKHEPGDELAAEYREIMREDGPNVVQFPGKAA